MTPTLISLHIMSGVCLLLFGLILIKNGVQRAFGAELRKLLSLAASNRFSAFATGVLATMMLQSATATTLLVTSFISKAMITAPVALAIVLGGHVGSTVVAQLLTFDLSWLAPLLMVIGFVFYGSRLNAGRKKQAGRMLIGIALVLMALTYIRQGADPLKQSDVLPLVLDALSEDAFFAAFLGAILAWICHSSLAVVMLLVTLVSAHALPVDVAVVMVLGVNIGGVMPAFIASFRDGVAAVRITAADILMRIALVAALFPFIDYLRPLLHELSMEDPAREAVNVHMAFNILLAIVALPCVGIMTRLTRHVVQEKQRNDDPGQPQYLDERALDTPTVALTYASREALRIADMIESMLRETIAIYETFDRSRSKVIQDMDNNVDRLHRSLKLYLARLGQQPLTDTEQERHFQILTFSTNLEHAGDIIDLNLSNTPQRMRDQNVAFSAEGFAEIRDMFQRVIDSVRLAQTVFLSADPALARQLLQDKNSVKKAELQTSKNHMTRLQRNIPESVATSGYHMDIVRDLRRINSMVTSVAYPILEKDGQLYQSLLKPQEDKTHHRESAE